MHPMRTFALRGGSFLPVRATPCLLLVALLGLLAAGPAGAQFVDVGASSGATYTGDGAGVGWFDADGDGDQDLFVTDDYTGFDGPELFFRNNGDGTFTEIWYPIGRKRSVGAADYDNDGDIDVLCPVSVSGNNGHRLMQNDGAGNFLNVGVAAGLDDNTAGGRAAAWADFDKDGDLDVFLGAAVGSAQLYVNNGDGTFTQLVNAEIQTTIGLAATWGDFDNDGDPDLFLGGKSAQNKLLRNDGGTLVNATPPVLAFLSNCLGAAWGDYDNDGYLDLYINAPKSYLFHNLAGGGFADVTFASGVPTADTNGEGIAWGDIDNDGRLDLIRAGRAGLVYYRNVTGSTFALGQSLAPGVWIAPALADYDGDGDLDLFSSADSSSILNSTTGTLFRNDQATGNHWVHVDLWGQVSNRFGIGARITVVAGGVRQIREVVSGEGYSSTNSSTAEFGLGAVTTLDSIIVNWPSGIVSYVYKPAIDRRHNLVEVSGNLLGVEPGTTGNLRFVRAFPDPFRETTQIDFALASPARVRLEVHDLQGRRVTTLLSGALEAGRHTASWDGRSAAGGTVGAGIYFVSLESEGQILTRRVARIR